MKEIRKWLKQTLFKEEYERIQVLESGLLGKQNEADRLIGKLKSVKELNELSHDLDVCKSKRVYECEQAAQLASLALYHMDGRLTRAYKCTVCPNWHLTHGKALPVLLNKELVGREVRRREGNALMDMITDEKVRQRLMELSREESVL